MSKYKRNGKWTIRVPHPDGGVVEKAIGTGNTTVAGNYETMCDLFLARPQDHVFLVAVCANRLKVRKLYSHWINKTLDTLRAQLADVNLAPHLTPWRQILIRDYGTPERAQDTARKYPDQAQAFFGWATNAERPDDADPIWITSAPLSLLTPERVTAFLASTQTAAATQRRYWAALKSFIEFLGTIRVLDSDPIEKVTPPVAADPRTRHLSASERDSLIEATPEGPIRTAEVLAHMGLELSAIQSARTKDVSIDDRTVFAHGTKHKRGRINYRSRLTDIPAWALPYLKRAIRFQHPNALLVPIGYGAIRRGHHNACEAIGVTDYRIHDGRHTYAVFMKRAGTPSEVIGLQLGHKDGQQVEKVYGQYKPKPPELAHWRDVAEAHHKKREVR